MNRQHILSRLGSRGWKITYSNDVPFTWEFLEHLKKGGLSARIEKQDHIQDYMPGLCVPRSLRFSMVDRYAIQQHCRRLKQAAGLSAGQEFIIVCFDPGFFPYIEELDPTFTALHIYDLYGKIGYDSALFNTQLEKLLTRSDLITASSQYQIEAVAKGHECKSHVVHNSADYESIHSARAVFKEPIELKGIGSPRVGYLGAINRKIDFSCLLTAARNNQSWQFVFVGPVNKREILASSQKDAYQQFQQLKNVHFIGQIEKHKIPSFLLSMHVHVMSFGDGEGSWSKHSYPLKLNEYLATGCPVVSSILPVVQEACGDLIYFADSPEEWESQLRQAIDEDSTHLTSSRRAFAKENSWDQRVDTYESLILQMIDRHQTVAVST